MIQEITDHAIILLDSEGTIENWNKGAEKIKGYTSKEIIGKNFRIFYTESDQMNRVPETLITEATINNRAQLEGWRVRKDGSLFWGLITITALHDADGEVIGFSKVTRDLTERLIAERNQEKYISEIEKKNKELEQFTYITSHDLQEPLRTISSFNELLQENYYHKMDEEGRFFTDMIAQAAERMRNLIYSILDYSRIGIKKEVDKAVDCNEIVTDIKKDMFKLISETGTNIFYKDLPKISCYKIELIQLFQNIISNAVKYQKKDATPEITISAEMTDEHWLFSVKDNGIGMDPKYIHKIFQIFQRLHNRDNYSGNGIGLANCKKIVELHHGEIWAESVLGQGSTFRFTISKNLSL